ncbi:MAG: cation-translocating P-type ATPase [Candidatus Bathyarchaeia archaeon]
MNSNVEGELEEFEESRNKRTWILLALALGSTTIVGGLLDLFAQGIPLGFVIPILNETATLSLIIYHVSVIAAGIYIGFIGIRELVIEKRFSVEFLMAVAGLGAAYLDFLFEAASVLFLYSLAEYFEGYIEDRARKTIEKLSKFMPDDARVIIDGTEKNISVREVLPGTTILVKPGERIPLDGTIVEGFSHVDQSLVTGESLPIIKKIGDPVYAGTLCTSGVLKVTVSKRAEDTLVSRIVKLVIESRKRKASIEKLVDRFAKVYVPIIIVLAVLTATVMPRILGGPFQTWLYRSLILLVVSCPSAFIVSVPATIFTAITVAARKGVIIKGGIYIEKLARIKTVIFDKTGTLTLGKPTVHEVKSVENYGEQALMYAAALDQFSNHPVAQAIVKKASERNLDITKLKVTDVTEIPGKGIVGYVNGTHVAVGNMELMKEYACNCEQIEGIYANEKHTSVCVSIDKSGIASVCMLDDVRKDAIKAIENLRKAGIKTAVLTGDKTEIAKEIAEKLGVDKVHAELFPEDKLKIVEEMKNNNGLVAMVGDGVNDAPALAASDVGIAMGGAGVDVALESADVVLVKDELAQIPYLIKLSGKTVEIAKQNIAASLIVKILLGGLGLMGFIPLWFTVASGDDGVTMFLLLNTLRLMKVKL